MMNQEQWGQRPPTNEPPELRQARENWERARNKAILWLVILIAFIGWLVYLFVNWQ
jgi:hypothetical protein